MNAWDPKDYGKQTFFKWVQGHSTPIQPDSSAERSRQKMLSFQFLPGMGSYCLRPAYRWWLRSPLWDTDGSWHNFNYQEPLEQRWELTQSQKFERQPGVWARLMRFISYMTPVHQNRKRWLFYLSVQKPTYRIYGNKKPSRCIPNERLR